MEQLIRAPRTGLRVNALGKMVRRVCILEDVSLELAPGSFYMLLGENGAGKTTLFRCLLGLTRHTGSVQVLGGGGSPAPTEVHGFSGITAVLDQASLYPRWNVRANIDYQLNDSAAHRRPAVNEIVPEKMLRTKAGKLSAGQRKLVMLATALASDARVLLLDEFSNGLDRPHRSVMREQLRKATHDGRIIVATGHDLETFEGLPTAAGLLAHRRLQDLTDVYRATGSLRRTYDRAVV